MRIAGRKIKIDEYENCLSASKGTDFGVFKFPRFILILAAALALHNANAAEVNVYAAASLTDVMKEIAANYEKANPDKIVFNFAASSLLARQITERAPVDIFISADEAKMDDLQKAGLIVTETRRDLLSNSLVIVVPNDSKLEITSPDDLLTKVQKIAIADPRAVPAGIYTKEYLGGLGMWDKLESKMVPTENVRTALAAVESGNVDAGFVYKTDANISKKVKIAFSVPVEEGPKIRYPVAMVKDVKNKTAAEAFLRYLESTNARGLFERYGFIVKF
jgi:molybdate transport system substrate-binding protein